MNCAANHVPILFEKHDSIETLIYPTFAVKLHKNANFKTVLFVPSSKQIRLWFHQSQLSLFRPFLESSKLDHKTCPVLLLVIEAWRC